LIIALKKALHNQFTLTSLHTAIKKLIK